MPLYNKHRNIHVITHMFQLKYASSLQRQNPENDFSGTYHQGYYILRSGGHNEPHRNGIDYLMPLPELARSKPESRAWYLAMTPRLFLRRVYYILQQLHLQRAIHHHLTLRQNILLAGQYADPLSAFLVLLYSLHSHVAGLLNHGHQNPP